MESKFDSWAIVEVMGHSRYAGRVTEQTIGGVSFVRVDVPDVVDVCGVVTLPAFTKLLGGASIFAITPVSEVTARTEAAMIQAQPMNLWDIRDLVKRAKEPDAIADSSDVPY